MLFLETNCHVGGAVLKIATAYKHKVIGVAMAELKDPQEQPNSKMETSELPVPKDLGFGDIVTLNVGGRK